MDVIGSLPKESAPGLSLLGKSGLGAISLAVGNASLLYFYIAFELSLFQLVIVYWWECFWIGIFSVLKLITASVFGSPYENRFAEFSPGANLFTSIFAVGLAGTAFLSVFGGVGLAIFFAFDMLVEESARSDVYDSIGLILGSSIILIVGHGLSFVINFLVLGEFRTARAGSLIALPFKRCIALIGAVAVAFAGVIYVPGLASTTGFAAVLIIVKLIWDFRRHLVERRDFAASGEAGSVAHRS